MRPWYSVGALAIAARRANVAGVVRLSCTPEGLTVELIRVTAAALGFAPGGVAEPVAFRVPYTAVRGLVREGRLLYLALDPAAVTPYNRFALARFAEDPDEVLTRAHLARDRARWASFVLPAPAGALAAALISADLAGGALGRAALGAVVALAVWAILRELSAWATWGGPFSDRLRDRFEKELAERLALVPTNAPEAQPAARLALPRRRVAAPAPPPPLDLIAKAEPARIRPPPASARPAPPLDRRPEPARLPRAVLAAIGAAVGVVAAVGFLRRYGAARPPPPALDRARTGLAAAVAGVRLDVPPLPKAETCLCVRADSPLWKDGVPQLSILTFESDEGPTAPPLPTLDDAGFPKFAFDLVIVNNGARGLRDVRVTLTFARRNKAGARLGAVDRGLFWEGVLAPGHAAKWHVRAPGGEVKEDVSVSGTLASRHLDPAPADAFYALKDAKVRAPRVHGAVMLAYLRDPRALTLARALAARSPADAETLARVRRAAAPVFACDVRREGERLEACVFNASTQPKGGLSLREVLPSSAAPGAEPRTVPIAETIPVHEGLRLRLDVPGDLADELAWVDPSVVE